MLRGVVSSLEPMHNCGDIGYKFHFSLVIKTALYFESAKWNSNLECYLQWVSKL